jgi:hypothetical protein
VKCRICEGDIGEGDLACAACGAETEPAGAVVPVVVPEPGPLPSEKSDTNFDLVYVAVALLAGSFMLGIGPFDTDNSSKAPYSSSLTAEQAMANYIKYWNDGNGANVCDDFMYGDGRFLNMTDYNTCIADFNYYYMSENQDNLTLTNLSSIETSYRTSYTGSIYVVSFVLESCYPGSNSSLDCYTLEEESWEWAKSNGNGRWGTPQSGYFFSFAGSKDSDSSSEDF